MLDRLYPGNKNVELLEILFTIRVSKNYLTKFLRHFIHISKDNIRICIISVQFHERIMLDDYPTHWCMLIPDRWIWNIKTFFRRAQNIRIRILQEHLFRKSNCISHFSKFKMKNTFKIIFYRCEYDFSSLLFRYAPLRYLSS